MVQQRGWEQNRKRRIEIEGAQSDEEMKAEERTRAMETRYEK